MRLSRVFNYLELVFFGNGVNGIHVGRLTIQMRLHDGFSARGNGCFDERGVNVVGACIRLHRHRRGPGVADGQPGGNIGIAGLSLIYGGSISCFLDLYF